MDWSRIDWPYTAEVFANWASIATASVAVVFFTQFHLIRWAKRQRLEKYLKAVEMEAERTRAEQGARTLLHLMKHVGMSETDVMDASFRSKCIRRLTTVDEEGRAERLLLIYDRHASARHGRVFIANEPRPGRARF